MAVYAYCRVSTTQQVEDGLSLESQQRQLEGYAMMHGMEIDEVFTEKGVSAGKPIVSRPAGSRLWAAVGPGDRVLVAKLDRLFRSAREALVVSDELQQRGVSLHLLDLGGDITDNGLSKVFFTIVAAFAEFERDRTAERIRDVKKHEADKGRYLGGARPFGYQVLDDGELEENYQEKLVREKVLHLRETGLSYRAIAEHVSDLYPGMNHMTVKRLIERATG